MRPAIGWVCGCKDQTNDDKSANGLLLSPVQVEEAPFIRGMEPFGGMSLPEAPLSRQILYGGRTDNRQSGYMAIAGRV